MGFQASAMGDAVQIINDMVSTPCCPSPLYPSPNDYIHLQHRCHPAITGMYMPNWLVGPSHFRRTWRYPETGEKTTIFLGYTSDLISSGLRETLRYLVQHKHVSAIVTTAGGIEEDFIKCLAPTYLGSFATPGPSLRAKGLDRICNT